MDRPLKRACHFDEARLHGIWRYASLIAVGWVMLVAVALVTRSPVTSPLRW